MSIADRLPAMTLPELTRLEANAARLAAGAPGKQRDEAASVLPLIEAEIAARREGKKRAVEKAPKETVAREPKAPMPRAPKVAKPVLTEAQKEALKTDRLLAGIDEALARKA